MKLTSRRRFVQQMAAAAEAFYGCPAQAFAHAAAIRTSGEQDAVRLDAAAIRKLASEISGNLITGEQSEYDSARMVFNRAFDRRPALIVRCASADDVARAIGFAHSHNLPLAVRGGGHSRAGFGVCDKGVVVDLSTMRRVEVDVTKRTARAGAGSLVRDLDQVTQRVGLATTSGGCPTVGIAGFTLGGGEGLLMSKYGAACDNLLSAHVVTVDGRLLEASHQSSSDLFWAIRGGGGNFGVVTALEYRLHTVGEVLSGSLTYSAHQIPEMLHAFAKFAASAPDEMNIFGEILPSEEGLKFLIHVCYCSLPSVGNNLLKPLRALKPQDDTIRAMPYLAAQSAGFVPAPFEHFQTNLFLPKLNGEAVEAIKTAISDAPPRFRILIVPLFGAVSRVPSQDTAFALRQPGYEVDMLGSWGIPAEREASTQWVKALRDSLQPFAHGTYVNQLGETSEQLVRSAYGPNYKRLVEIKKKYDPTNVLQLNQNIKPV